MKKRSVLHRCVIVMSYFSEFKLFVYFSPQTVGVIVRLEKENFQVLSMHNKVSILSVNEKLPVSKFRYFGKYIIQLDGYFYVHVSGQRGSGMEKKISSTIPGTMVHVMHVLFVFFAVFENYESIIFMKQYASTCPRRFL